jgi:hypothetical protein
MLLVLPVRDPLYTRSIPSSIPLFEIIDIQTQQQIPSFPVILPQKVHPVQVNLD